MIWDEGLRTALHSVQRVLVLKRTAGSSVDGGPLTANVVFVSDQHIAALVEEL
ncbi:hypothetical protein [Mesotoga sp. B105.6.4]|uniref:hypothetical protein n=1 Tax=Mesotoga sp. B105.6.4 TaxID=1582224 RepID=UPI0015E08CFB|nr:hypothetical protein [Mesotoga sp. B105.6.4]